MFSSRYNWEVVFDGKYCSRSRIMAWLLVLGQDNVYAARFRPPSFLRRYFPGTDETPDETLRYKLSRLVYSEAYLERVCSTVDGSIYGQRANTENRRSPS